MNQRTLVAEASLSRNPPPTLSPSTSHCSSSSSSGGSQQLRLRSSVVLLNCSPAAVEVSLSPQVVGANPSRQRAHVSRSLSSLLQRKGKARVGEGDSNAGGGGKEGRGVEEGAVAVDAVFENQRHLPLSGWRGGHLLPTDPKRWTTTEGGSNVSPAAAAAAAAAFV